MFYWRLRTLHVFCRVRNHFIIICLRGKKLSKVFSVVCVCLDQIIIWCEAYLDIYIHWILQGYGHYHFSEKVFCPFKKIVRNKFCYKHYNPMLFHIDELHHSSNSIKKLVKKELYYEGFLSYNKQEKFKIKFA